MNIEKSSSFGKENKIEIKGKRPGVVIDYDGKSVIMEAGITTENKEILDKYKNSDLYLNGRLDR